MRNFLSFILCTLISFGIYAQTFINTTGSDNSLAISGYDPVSFFNQKNALLGKAEYSLQYLDATWYFATEENRAAFQATPEKYMPEFGGHCAACIAENCISAKKINGDFEFIDGKLYLFSYGNRSKSSSRESFIYGRKALLLRDAEKFWPELKGQLLAGSLVQKDSKTYRKMPWE